MSKKEKAGKIGGNARSGAFLTGAEEQKNGPKFTPNKAGKKMKAPSPTKQMNAPALSTQRRTIDLPIIRPLESPDQQLETKKVEVPTPEELAKAWGIHQQSLHELEAKKRSAALSSSPSSSSGPITRETRIMDVVAEYPEVVPFLLDVGLHCIGCTLSAYDTVQTGCELHGFDQATIDSLIKAMNEVIAGKKKENAQAKKENAGARKREAKAPRSKNRV